MGAAIIFIPFFCIAAPIIALLFAFLAHGMFSAGRLALTDRGAIKDFIDSPYFITFVVLSIVTIAVGIGGWVYYLNSIEPLSRIGPYPTSAPPLRDRILTALPMLPMLIALAFLASLPVWILVLIVQALIMKGEAKLAASGSE